ncbi:MAG: hypothetical protein IKT39_06420 [Clostridia bacterium]|nr:hypothetical protein [Clostridia bacterium]
MNILKKIYCRIYQFAFHAALPLLPYREPQILNQVGEIADKIKSLHLHSALLITDEFLKTSGATAKTEQAQKNAQKTL